MRFYCMTCIGRHGHDPIDADQVHIPCGTRMTLGLPTAKLNEALERLRRYVL